MRSVFVAALAAFAVAAASTITTVRTGEDEIISVHEYHGPTAKTILSTLQENEKIYVTTALLQATSIANCDINLPLQDAVKLISDHHISGLPVVDAKGALIGELSEQDLMVRESDVDAGPYVMLLDSVIYLRNPLN